MEFVILLALVGIGIATTMGGRQASDNLHKVEVMGEMPTNRERSMLWVWVLGGVIAAGVGIAAALGSAGAL